MRDLKKTNNDDGSVTLTWNTPLNFKGDHPEYVVEYNGQRYLLEFTQTEFIIPAGQDKKSFTVKVRSEKLASYASFMLVYSQMQHTDKRSQHRSIIWPVWLNS